MAAILPIVHTVSAGEATSRSFDTGTTPPNPNLTLLSLAGAGTSFFGDGAGAGDVTMTGSTVSWAATVPIQAGDIIYVQMF